MQVYTTIMKDKYDLFLWNALIMDKLTGPRLMSEWNAWGWC